MTATRTFEDVQVLFDWNGTLVADADRARQATNEVLAGHDLIAIEPDAFPSTFRLPLHEMFRAVGVAPAQLPQAEQQWNQAMAVVTPVARLGAMDVLTELRQRMAWVGIVSAASPLVLHNDLDRLGMTALPHAVVTDASDKLAELQSRRALRDVAVYVGDTEYDMMCARRAGYVAVGIRGGYCTPGLLREAGAHVVLDELTELIPLLEIERPLS